MHFEQFQPDPFQILGGNCVADQKIVLISSFYRNQILLDGNRASAGRLKADIVDIKGGCSVIGTFNINRQILAAHAVIAVAPLKFNPAVSSIDGLRR
ncbi:hypothetical protein D3C86_1834950 [compost metagenome]